MSAMLYLLEVGGGLLRALPSSLERPVSQVLPHSISSRDISVYSCFLLSTRTLSSSPHSPPSLVEYTPLVRVAERGVCGMKSIGDPVLGSPVLGGSATTIPYNFHHHVLQKHCFSSPEINVWFVQEGVVQIMDTVVQICVMNYLDQISVQCNDLQI